MCNTFYQKYSNEWLFWGVLGAGCLAEARARRKQGVEDNSYFYRRRRCAQVVEKRVPGGKKQPNILKMIKSIARDRFFSVSGTLFEVILGHY